MQDFKIPEDYDVYFEKWVDPYEVSEESKRELLHQQGFQFEDEDDEEDDDGETIHFQMPVYENPIKAIMTTFGLMPLAEHSLASKQFKFWTGHTNFNLLKPCKKCPKGHAKIIAGVLGVESVEIQTPLRFKMAVGKLFQDRDVMAKVREKLLESLHESE